jgi:hypothetical protein
LVFRQKRLVKSVAIVGITLAYLASATFASATLKNGPVFMGNFPFPGTANGIDVCLTATIYSPGRSPLTAYPHFYAAIKIVTPTAQHNCSGTVVALTSGSYTLVMAEWMDGSKCTTVSASNPSTTGTFSMEGWYCGNPSGLQVFRTETMAKIQCSWDHICSTRWIGSGNQSF